MKKNGQKKQSTNEGKKFQRSLKKGTNIKKVQNGLRCHEAPYLLAKKAEMEFLKLSTKSLSCIKNDKKLKSELKLTEPD